MGKTVGKRSVADIVVEKLINKIENEGVLPWHKPFIAPCMNWYSKTEYRGINKVLLDGGEYITPNQLKKYNETHKTNYWFEKGTPYEIVVFYSKTEKQLTDKQVEDIKANGVPDKWVGKIYTDVDGSLVKRSWLLRYYRVYNIEHIKDKDGNKLPPKLGKTVVEQHTNSEDIVNKYIGSTGVSIHNDSTGAYYTHLGDEVHLPKPNYFDSVEAYYRVLFHELIHSTGTNWRLNRACFEEYHTSNKIRGKEELIAEMGGLLLASEAGFREDTQLADNSLNYVQGWVSWMKGNPTEVLNGMLQAEKAKNFILSGGQIDEDASVGACVSIDSGKGVSYSE